MSNRPSPYCLAIFPFIRPQGRQVWASGSEPWLLAPAPILENPSISRAISFRGLITSTFQASFRKDLPSLKSYIFQIEGLYPFNAVLPYLDPKLSLYLAFASSTAAKLLSGVSKVWIAYQANPNLDYSSLKRLLRSRREICLNGR